MIDRRQFLSVAALAAAGSAWPGRGGSAAPARSARILVGFPAGGAADYVARLLAANLQDHAETVIVENVAGAGGRIALQALANAVPDGTVMALSPGDQLSLFPHIYRRLQYDPQRHFAPVGTVCTVQFLLTVGPAVPSGVTSLDGFLAWCRANPGLATYGTPGAGTRQHLLGASLARSAGVALVHVPYRGAAPAMQDLLAGQIAAGISVVSNPLPYIASGKLRALATTAPARSPTLPDVPTFREAGHPSLEAVEAFGILLPRAAPPAAVDGLNAAVLAALARPEVRNGLAKFHFEPAGSSPGEYANLIASDFQKWGEVVRHAGLAQSLDSE